MSRQQVMDQWSGDIKEYRIVRKDHELGTFLDFQTRGKASKRWDSSMSYLALMHRVVELRQMCKDLLK